MRNDFLKRIEILSDKVFPKRIERVYIVVNNGMGASKDSVHIKFKKQTYLSSFEFLLCRINKNNEFISFKPEFKDALLSIGILEREYSDGYCKVDLLKFLHLEPSDYEKMEKSFLNLVVNNISAEPFGCCGKFRECSIEKRCLHDDTLYSKACQYRKNLENGNIFY